MIALVSIGNVSGARAEVTVFAAASLTDLFAELVQSYQDNGGTRIVLVTGASSSLARQIVSGAPADFYVSANLDWAEYVANGADFAAPIILYGNELVVISDGPKVSPDLRDLPGLLAGGRLALGDPSHVPAGIYARAALEAAGIWDEVVSSLVPASDVRTAVGYVKRGAAQFGVVYRTDVQDDLQLAGVVDPDLYPPISYYAVARQAGLEELADFISYLQSAAAHMIVVKQGFKIEERTSQ